MRAAADLLSPAWLSEHLGQPVASASTQRIGMDRGFAGTVLRVGLLGPDGAPSSVVAKLGPDSALDAEISFYQRLALRTDAPAPRCLYAGNGPQDEPVLLIEDVPTVRAGDALAGAAPDDVAAVLESMARFWTHRGSEPGLSELPGWGSPAAQRQLRYRHNWTAQRDALAAELPDDIWRLAEKLSTSLGSVVAELHNAPSHALHADLHMDNVLFTDDRAVVLDWGSICTGPAAIDIFGFITTTLGPQDQQAHFADLVDELNLDSAGIDHGRRRLLCALAGVIGWRNRAPTDIPRERALRTAAIADGRLVNALRLWDAARILP